MDSPYDTQIPIQSLFEPKEMILLSQLKVFNLEKENEPRCSCSNACNNSEFMNFDDEG